MSPERLNQDLAAVEAALTSLSPAPSTLDRDRVMYLAGQASGRRQRASRASWLWPCTTAATVLVACTLGVLLAGRSQPQMVERIVYVESGRPGDTEVRPHEASVAEGGRESLIPSREQLPLDYLKLRQLVLAHGIDALPEPKPAMAPDRKGPPSPSDYRHLLEQIEG
jgi:hypothetical protein